MAQPDATDKQGQRPARTLSKRAWVLIGIFAWGVPVFLITTWLNYPDELKHFPSDTVSLLGFAARLVSWVVLGYFFGLSMGRSQIDNPKAEGAAAFRSLNRDRGLSQRNSVGELRTARVRRKAKRAAHEVNILQIDAAAFKA